MKKQTQKQYSKVIDVTLDYVQSDASFVAECSRLLDSFLTFHVSLVGVLIPICSYSRISSIPACLKQSSARSSMTLSLVLLSPALKLPVILLNRHLFSTHTCQALCWEAERNTEMKSHEPLPQESKSGLN